MDDANVTEFGVGRDLYEQIVDLRRDLHRHPELSHREHRTVEVLAQRLDTLGINHRSGVAGTGVVAEIPGRTDGPIVALRADTDALPILEETGLPFASKIENRMHACGHDSHTAMLASAARLLSHHRDELKGKVKFMFQPGEEDPGGAEPMIAEGLLDIGGKPDAAFAIHIAPNQPAGLMGCRAGNRVVIAMRNWPEWSIAFWAIVSLGAVAVPLNAWGSRAELERDIARSEPRAAIVDDERRALVDPLQRGEFFQRKRARRMNPEFTEESYMQQVKQAYVSTDDPQHDEIVAVIDRLQTLLPGPDWKTVRWPWAVTDSG